MKKKMLTVLMLCAVVWSAAAEYYLSNKATASLVTVGPGEVIYQFFGHSIFRIHDPENDLDLAYNFGIVPFSEEDFVSNFIHGNLDYLVEKSLFRSNLALYTHLERELREYTLNLNRDQVQALYNYMEWHVKPENKRYLYLFFHDNCSTRIRDMFEKTGVMELILPKAKKKITFRQLIAGYLEHSAWTRLGLFFMLNSSVDTLIQPKESMGLPEYLEYYFTKARIKDYSGEKPLIIQKEPEYLNSFRTKKLKSDFWYSPIIVFSLIFILAVFASVFKWKFRVFDFIVFFISGLLGAFLLFLWFGTNHVYGHHNWNLAWALPFHIFGAFLVFGNTKIKKHYFKANTIILTLLLPVSFIIRQKLPLDVLPFIFTLFVRSFVLSGLKVSTIRSWILKKVQKNKS